MAVWQMMKGGEPTATNGATDFYDDQQPQQPGDADFSTALVQQQAATSDGRWDAYNYVGVSPELD
jgi:hypothetical protein